MMRLIGALGLAAVLTACSPQQQQDAERSPVAAAEKRLPLPDCDGVAPSPDDGRVPDCRIQSADQSGLAFEARRAAANSDGVMRETISVVAPGDATVQTIEEEIEASAMPPHLEDLDGDGRDELTIPLRLGNVNTTFAVWRRAGDEAAFARLGELAGVSFSRTADGAIAVAARSSAAEWVVEYYRINGETLNALARAVVTSDGAGGQTCVAEDAGAMTALGLTPEEVQRRYCEDPAAAKIFE